MWFRMDSVHPSKAGALPPASRFCLGLKGMHV